MRFLVTAHPEHPVPPEMVVGLYDAMLEWVNQLKESSKAETPFGYAGVAGGGCILNVASAAEANSIMARFPFGPFSDVRVTALVDVVESLTKFKQVA